MGRVVDGVERAEREGIVTSASAEADEHLIREAEKIAVALGRMFPGLCEVVLHDLRDPRHAIRAIENNLSGREVGDSVTELGLARIKDPGYPSVIQNYPNRFPDGRPAKSTSIGIEFRRRVHRRPLPEPRCVGAVTGDARFVEPRGHGHRAPRVGPGIPAGPQRARAAPGGGGTGRGACRDPRSLSRDDKKAVVRQLHQDGYFDSRDAAQTIADLLGISRATVYNYIK